MSERRPDKPKRRRTRADRRGAADATDATDARRGARARAPRATAAGEASAANPEWLEQQLAMRRRERQRQRRTSQATGADTTAPSSGDFHEDVQRAAGRGRATSAAGTSAGATPRARAGATPKARPGTTGRPARANAAPAPAPARRGKSTAAPARPRRAPRVVTPPTRAELRARERRRLLFKRRMRIVIAVTALVAVVVGLYSIPRSALFRVHEVQISGSSAVPDLAVRARIDPLLAGKTVFTANLGAVRASIEQLPFVHSVTVTRHLPDGLNINITEYQPLALGLAQNGSWLVARDGRVLVKARLTDWSGRVPVVRLSHANVSPGDRVGDEPALQLLRVVPATFPGSFHTVELTPAGIIGAVADGPQVKIGRADQFVEKLLVAQRLLSLYNPVQRAKIAYIDVTVPSRPALMMHG